MKANETIFLLFYEPSFSKFICAMGAKVKD